MKKACPIQPPRSERPISSARSAALLMALVACLTAARTSARGPNSTEPACDPVDARQFAAFTDQLLIAKDPRGAYEKFAAPDMVQHNPPFGASRDSTIEQWETMTALPTSHFTILSRHVEGDMATVRFRGRLKPDQPGALVTQHDRFKCGLIVAERAEFSIEKR